MSNQITSDIISDIFKQNRLECSEFEIKNDDNANKSNLYTIESYEIRTDEESKKVGRPKGKYHIINISDIRNLSKSSATKLVKIVANRIKDLIGVINCKTQILVVGLGNENIESDSLGPKVTKNIIVTRLLYDNNSKIPKVCAITPSVMGITGIDTADIISAVVKKIKPTLVIVVDSLCASASERLGKSIQITNVGIIPGGGINRPKTALNESILGCKVITVGIPLMIFAKTLGECVEDKNLVVTFHDISVVVEKLAKLLARAINYTILNIDGLQ